MQHHSRRANCISAVLLLVFSWLLAAPLWCVIAATSYSYSSFVGPVSGPEQRIYVNDAISGGTRVDYVARPDYQFAYGVEDVGERVLHNRREIRDGDAVEGVYSVLQPDGNLRVVKYTADNANGFQAEVITGGEPTLHGYNAPGVSQTPGQLEHFVQHAGREATKPQQQAQYEVHEGDDAVEEDDENAAEQPNSSSAEQYENNDEAAGDSSEEGYEEATSYETHSNEQDSTEDY